VKKRFVGARGWALGAGGSLVGAARLALGAGIALTLGAVLVAAQQRPVFRGGANFVLVDAYPSRDGRIVEGLTAADFQILEDGKPQTVDSIEFVRIEPTPEAARQDPNTVAESMAQAADPHNRVFVVFLDSYHTTVAGSHDIRTPLVDTLNRIIAPNDLYGLTTQYHRAKDLVLARKLNTLEDQLTRYWPWGERNRITRGVNGQTDPMEDKLENCFHIKHKKVTETQWVPENWIVHDGPVDRYLDDILIERYREDKTLTKLEELIVYLGQLREARSTVLLVSDGWLLLDQRPDLTRQPDNDIRSGREVATVGKPLGNSQLGSVVEAEFAECLGELNRLVHLSQDQRFRDLLTRASRSNVSFYPIAASGLMVFDRADASTNVRARADGPPRETVLGRDAQHLGDRVTSLRELAENTDGIAIVNTNDLKGGLRRIADDVSAYYLLGYYSTNNKFDGKFRKIDVKMKTPGLSVHARHGYLAPAAGPGAAPPPAASADAANGAAAGTAAAATGVNAALDALARTKDTADVFMYGAASGAEITVVVELSSGQIGRGAWPKGARVQLDLTGAGGVRVGTASATIDPGARSTVVRVAAIAGDGPWNALARVTGGTADDLDGRAEIRRVPATLVGEPLVFRATPAPASPLRAVADFRYRRTERVHVEWPVLAALDRREARLLDRNGQPLPVPVNLTERDVNGRPSVAADVNLAPLTAGDYVIELTVGSGAGTERKLIAIRVVS
jgi:VWFA-related protein